MAKRKMIPTPADNIAKQIMETYQPQDAQEIQDVIKRIFAPIFEAALKGEMQNHMLVRHASDSNSSRRIGRAIPGLSPYGRTTSRMSSSCFLTAAPCARSCIRRTRSRA